MSGPIRQKIGPLTKNLKDRINKLKSYVVPALDEDKSKEDHIEELEGLLDDLDEDLNRIADWSDTLAQLDQQWQALIASEDDGVEQSEFDKFLTKNDYSPLIFLGQEAASKLENQRSKLFRAINKWKKEAGQPKLDESSGRALSRANFNPQVEGGSMSPEASRRVSTGAQLPKIGYKMYNGDWKYWSGWKNWFTVTVLNKPIPKIDQFLHLHACVEPGSLAAACIAPIEITEENFELAWATLEKTCGNKKKIIRGHWTTIHNIEPIKNNSAASSELRKHFEELSLAIMQLKHAGEEVESRSIMSILEKKWPPRIVDRLLDREEDAAVWNTTKMLECLDDIIRRQEEVRSLCYGDDAKKQPKFQKQQSSPTKSHQQKTSEVTSAFMVSEQQGKGKNAKKFKKQQSLNNKKPPYCTLHEEQGHWSSDCPLRTSEEAIKKRLKDNHRCTNCTRKDHVLCDKPIKCAKCFQTGHHVIFHKESNEQKPPRPNKPSTSVNLVENNSENVHFGTFSIHAAAENFGSRKRMLYLVEVLVFNPRKNNNSMKVLAVLDSGAEQSFIASRVADFLKIDGPTKPLNLSTFGAAETLTTEGRSIKVGVKTFDGSHMKLDFLTIKYMMRPVWTVLVTPDFDFNATFMEPRSYQPEMLIGLDNYNEVTLPMKQRLPSQFWRQSTIFGSVVGGRGLTVQPPEYEVSENAVGIFNVAEPHMHKKFPVESKLEKIIKTQYEIEKLGIVDNPEKDADDEEAKRILKLHMKFNEEGRIEVPLLWKDQNKRIPSNKGLAYGRFTSEFRKLKRTPVHLKQYDKNIKGYLKNDICEVVVSGRLDGIHEVYLPHHAVIKESSNTTKVRKVNDASAGDLALNDVLYKGPSMIPDAAGFVLRFRIPVLVVVMDIKKAFLQLSVRTSDRDALRFFWVINAESDPTPDNVIILRYKKLPFGLVCAPFEMGAAIEFLMDFDGSDVATEIKENSYVDNISLGSSVTEDLIHKCHEAKRIFGIAKMELREFLSNDKAVNDSIPAEERIQHPITKVIGIPWNSEADTLDLQLVIPKSEAVTKRNVLKSIAKCYDPLGYMIPVLLAAKIFCQSLWIRGFDWDQPVPPEDVLKWNLLVEDWKKFKKSIRRHVSGSAGSKFQLHGFCDASTEAYATAIILRVQEPDGRCFTNLIFAKGHLKPLKGLTIPQMELMAVLVGCRAVGFVEKQLRLQIERKVVWTDSTAVIGWISSSKKHKVFLENRLIEIRKCRFEHRHVSTEDNVADCATRGLGSEEFMAFDLWWIEPDWLAKEDSEWPKNEFVFVPEEKEVEEPVEDEVSVEPTSVVVNSAQINKKQAEFPVKIEKFSSLAKLTWVLMLMLHWLNLIKDKTVKALGMLVNRAPTASEHDQALRLLIKNAQQEFPPDEKMKKRLDLKLDGFGILRCHGRLENSELQEEAKNPIFLPPRAYLTKLIVLDRHRRNCHLNAASLLAYIQGSYWIPQGRRTVKWILRNGCQHCRRYEAQPYRLPQMPPLPAERLVRIRPMEHCGIDLFGPIMIRQDKVEKKVWGVLLVCMVTRFVVLDAATDLTTFTFVQVLQRLIANYGKPRVIVTDNQPSFKQAEKALKQAWKEMKEPIEWEFLPSHMPWAGGFYEAMVKLCKNVLRRVIGRSILNYNSLTTLLARTQATLNTRPLTFISDEFNEQKVIRPIDFVNFGAEVKFPMLKGDNEEVYRPNALNSREKLLVALEQEEKYFNLLWTTFQEFYLKALREKHRMVHNQAKSSLPRSPRIGEIVIIYDEFAPRAVWRLGKVVEQRRSHDGEVWAVKLKTQKGILERPINLCYPLEIEAKAPDDPVPKSSRKGDQKAEKSIESSKRYDLRPRNKKGSKFFILAVVSMLIFLAGKVQADINVEIKCVDHGLEINVAPGVTQFRVCVEDHCLERRPPKAYEYFGLPTEKLMYRQIVKFRYFIDDREYQEIFKCPKRDFCKINDCILCWRAVLYVMQCLPWWLEAILCLAGTLILLILYTFVKTVQKAIKMLAILCPCLKLVIGVAEKMLDKFWSSIHAYLKRFWKGKKETHEDSLGVLPTVNPEVLAARRRRDWRINFPLLRQNRYLAVVCLILALGKFTEGKQLRECSEVEALTVAENLCRSTGVNSTLCRISQSTIVNVPPMGQSACLLLRNAEHHPLATLKLRFLRLTFKCKPIRQHCTRKIEIQDVSTHLCPHDGSCKSDWCSKIKPYQLADEFNGLPNQRPGFTHCSQGSSSWVLGGCALPSSSCVPYRVYAQEVVGEDAIYTIFGCHYEEEVLVEAQLDRNFPTSKGEDTSISMDYKLIPAVPNEKNGVKLTMLTQVLPPESMKKFFVTNGTTTALLDKETYHQSKLFTCASEEKARKMDCTLRFGSSQCTIAENQANCIHEKFTMDKVLEKDHLPIIQPRVIFKKDNKTPWPWIEFTQETSLAVVVNLQDLEMNLVVDVVDAEIEFLGIHGCAGCASGAEFKMKCKSSQGITIHVECESIHFSLICTNSEVTREVHVAISKTLFKENCTARWPGGSYQAEVEAELYVADFDHLANLDKSNPRYSSVRRFGKSYAFLIDWLWSTWYMPFVAGAVTVVSIWGLMCMLCPCCLLCLSRVFRIRQHQD